MQASDRIVRIALTPGEPSGIGPDVCLLLAQRNLDYEPVFIADPGMLARRAHRLGFEIDIEPFDSAGAARPHRAGVMKVMPVELAARESPGRLDSRNARYVLKTIDRAVKGCLDGLFDAMTTGPVSKSSINEAGVPFTGHTEYIAEITGGHPVMMLTAPGLRVALATTHLPLSEVARSITRHRLRTVIRLLHRDLARRFAVDAPRILVCGLNPHAGEGGHLGREEIDVIEPVLAKLRKSGMDLIGPLPADTLFTPKYLDNADAVLAMYHDQGLPVLKHIGFGQAVNITLGLPIIRTSVDHGTALDLAGTGRADPGSLCAAADAALTMARNNC